MSGTRAISTTSRRELSTSFFFFFLQDKAPKEIHAILTETLVCFLPGLAKGLSASLCFSHISRSIQGCSVFQHYPWSRLVFNQVLHIFIRTAKIRIRLYFTKRLFPTIIQAFSFQILLWWIASIHLQTILFGLLTWTIFGVTQEKSYEEGRSYM